MEEKIPSRISYAGNSDVLIISLYCLLVYFVGVFCIQLLPNDFKNQGDENTFVFWLPKTNEGVLRTALNLLSVLNI